MKKIIIINCGGNILSLIRAINKNGYDPIITNEPDKIENATHIFLPGVGAFKNAMKRLENANIINYLRNIDYKKKKLMGICLGMQILLSHGEEDGYCEGLNLISGKVKKIEFKNLKKKNLKIPNIGWHKLLYKNNLKENLITKNIKYEDDCYFVHSYYVEPDIKDDCISYINYGNLKIPAIIKKNKIYGCQFHPEKSREYGLNLIENFLKLE